MADLRSNVVMLAKLATLLKIPVITTASEPNGPNGPLMPEIQQAAPHAVFVPRKGEVNAWDNEDFVKAVKATGRKTLIMAGVWTSVCVMFPALDAKAGGLQGVRRHRRVGRPQRDGFEDDPGPVRPGRRRSHIDQRRPFRDPPDVEPSRSGRAREAVRAGVAELPAVIESYQKAQDVARQTKK